MTTTTADEESEQATNRRDANRAKAFNQRMRLAREQALIGSCGPAGPCKRIDPRTGAVVEVLPASTRTPVPYPPANEPWPRRAKPLQPKRRRLDFGLNADDPRDQANGVDLTVPPWE